MREEYNLGEIKVLDSMHDLRVSNIILGDNKLILQYREIRFDENNFIDGSVYFESHKKFKACDVIFLNYKDPEDLEITAWAEVGKRNGKVKKYRYYNIDELIDFMNKKNCKLETIEFFIGNDTVLIESELVYKKSNRYVESCKIKICAERVIYEWR